MTWKASWESDMAKKRPPGWQKKQEQKNRERVDWPPPAPGFMALHGEQAREGLQQLLERMEKHPENFGGWGYFDAEGNEHEDLSFLTRGAQSRNT